MTFITQEQFGGVAPRVDERKLAPALAQTANNCLFERSNLRALRRPQAAGVSLSVGTETIYPYQGAWLQFDNYVHVAQSPIPNDAFNRIYISDATTYPIVRTGAATYRLGVPRPSAPPTVSAPAIEEDPDNLIEIEDIYYVVTLVDGFGAEGPPSSPSTVVTRIRNGEVTVTAPSVPTGNYNLGPGAKWRYYRSNTGTSDTAFQFVTETDISTTSFTDTVLNDELQELLPSSNWTGPPDDNNARWPDGPLQGLTLGPNGILSGFSHRTVYFSEPYLPHAWPLEYTITLRHEIVGITWISSGLLVVTKGDAAIIAGSYPGSMTVYTPERSWACTSAKSLVDMGGWAMYCSADGLVAVADQQFKLVTEALFTNNQWSQQVPLDGIAGNSEGRYVYFWEDDSSNTGAWVFDPAEGVNALTSADLYSDIAYHNDFDNLLYIRYNNGLARFDWGTTTLTYTWRSKVHTLPHPVNFAYLEVIANEYPVNVKLVAGDNNKAGNTTIFDAGVAGRFTVLPGGFEYTQWEIEVSDDKELVYVGLYEDMAEVG